MLCHVPSLAQKNRLKNHGALCTFLVVLGTYSLNVLTVALWSYLFRKEVEFETYVCKFPWKFNKLYVSPLLNHLAMYIRASFAFFSRLPGYPPNEGSTATKLRCKFSKVFSSWFCPVTFSMSLSYCLPQSMDYFKEPGAFP